MPANQPPPGSGDDWFYDENTGYWVDGQGNYRDPNSGAEVTDPFTGETSKHTPDTPPEGIDVQRTSGGGGNEGFEDPGGAGWFLNWLKGSQTDPWLDYTGGLKESFETYKSGVDVATESAIARGAESASERALSAAGGRGNLYSGMTPALQGAIWQDASGKMAESRSRTKQRGEGGIMGLANQYQQLLRGGMGAGGNVYGNIHGQAPFGGQWRSDPWQEQVQTGSSPAGRRRGGEPDQSTVGRY